MTNTMHAENLLADYNARIARKCEALGFTEHARDARRRQARMLAPIHAAALIENAIRSL